LGGLGRRTGLSSVDSLGGAQGVGDRVGGRGAQGEVSAAGQDRGSMSWLEGAHRIHTVRGAGSSIALSNTFAAPSVIRSASSTTMTCQRRREGDIAAPSTRPRVWSTPMVS